MALETRERFFRYFPDDSIMMIDEDEYPCDQFSITFNPSLKSVAASWLLGKVKYSASFQMRNVVIMANQIELKRIELA